MSTCTFEKNSEYLNSLLWTRINQYKMLNNTLTEMIRRDGSEDLINNMKKEIDETLNKIKAIKNDIKNSKEKKVVYTHYEPKKPDKRGFYDSIVKQTKAVELGLAEEKKNPLNYSDLYSEIVLPKKERKNDSDCFARAEEEERKELSRIRKEVKNVSVSTSNKYLDEINKTIDSRILGNRFLVHLDDIGIPEIMVKSVSFDPSSKQLSINVYDFVKDINGRKMPVLELLNGVPSLFKFTIQHLEANGNPIYTEKYLGCHITEIYRDPIDYSISEFSTIQILVEYQVVTYEANN